MTPSRTDPAMHREPFVRLVDVAHEVVAEASTEERAWVWVEGPEPDTPYRYRVLVDGQPHPMTAFSPTNELVEPPIVVRNDQRSRS